MAKKPSQGDELYAPPDTGAPPADSPQDKAPTVADHVARMFPANHRTRAPHPELHRHAAAAALHGWAQHEHHEAGPMALSAEDYDQALKAAAKLPKAEDGKRPTYKPHLPALSPHHPTLGAQSPHKKG